MCEGTGNPPMMTHTSLPYLLVHVHSSSQANRQLTHLSRPSHVYKEVVL